MDKVTETYNWLADSYTISGLLLMAAIVGLLCVQLYYWAGLYARVPGYRNQRKKPVQQAEPAISVIVVVRDEYRYITETLPLLLEQQYDRFEVVAVDLGSEPENTAALAVMQQRYPHLRTTRLIQQEQRFPITNKMALNVGIKAAAYPNILFTTTEARPASGKWLALMAKGFMGGQVVIGYCGIEPAPGMTNRLMRAGRLNSSLRYLAAAIKGRPYRGSDQNIGYTSALYFAAKGFDHLDLAKGDDDLFIQRIATPANTSVVMNPHATMRQQVWGTAGDWFRRQLPYRQTWRHYPQGVKNYIEFETWSRALFFASCGTAIACMPFEIGIAAGALVFLRLCLVELQVRRITLRLGERGLGWIYIVYDLFSPLYALALWAAGRFSRRSRWK